MLRVVAYLVSFGVVVGALLAPALFWNDGSLDDGAYEPTTITSYVADFDLDADGDLSVVETLTVNFPSGDRRGIFRFFDRVDPSAPEARREVEDVEVTMDGGDVEFDMQSQENGRVTVAKIGSADVFLDPGNHVYEISYRIDGVIQPGTQGTTSQFYWNLIPSGWQQTITSSRLTVDLPTEAAELQCVVGLGDGNPCDIEGEGTDTLVVSTGEIARNTPVTVRAGLDIETPPAGKTLPWSGRFDRVLGTNVVGLGIVLLLALGAAVVGAIAARRSYEKNPQFPLMYAPPEGIGPAQAKYVLTEDVDQETYVATLMYAAERGAIGLDKTADSWTITDKSGAHGWAGLDPVTTGIAHLLGGPGAAFVANPKDVEAGKRLKAEIDSFDTSVSTWGASSGHIVSSGLGGLGGMLVLAGFLAVGATAIWNPFSMTAVGLIPGAFAICAAPLLKTGSGTRRTRQGRELWSRVGGFHRVLSTPSSQERFDFSGREELYTAYIPWAVALGCADEWAAKYRTEMAQEPPAPRYLGGAYAGAYVGSHIGSMVSDFDSTVSSAISSYNATQSSSSSGGGGFSGGGGGGGGGGGSW